MSFSIGHVGINVSDLARSLPFYAELLDLKVVQEIHEGERHVGFLMGGEGIFLTIWQQSTGSFSTSRPGLHHLAFQVADADAVVAFEAKLRERNVTLEYGRIVSHGPNSDSGGLFFLDPDGIRLEVYSPTGMSGYDPA
jgi:catechol 2,3-dioxygenase-like lactoylglutathione lyase family enzyme